MAAALDQSGGGRFGAVGSGQAMECFVQQYYADIFRYCRWHTRDYASAEDAAQETFLKFVRFSDRFTDTGKTRAFLYRIAKNTCIDLMRKGRAAELPEDAAYEEMGFCGAEASAEVQMLFQSIEESEKELILLRFAQELSFREIADITGIPMRTVQTRIRKALNRMKTMGKGEKP